MRPLQTTPTSMLGAALAYLQRLSVLLLCRATDDTPHGEKRDGFVDWLATEILRVNYA